MDYYRLHPWSVVPKEARRIQIRLRKRLPKRPPSIPMIRRVAAADVAYKGDYVYSVIAVFEFPSLKVIEVQFARTKVKFPYIPGLLAFREGPSLLRAFKKIKSDPHVILFDGHGTAHPIRMGIATHLGILLDKPTIGCAKSRLVGMYKIPKKKRGSFSYLILDGGIGGAALRTRDGVKPIFVSPGFKINIKDAIDTVLLCTREFRMPEPIRFVHTLSVKKSKGIK